MGVYNIGSQHGAMHLFYPLVVHFMPRFYVMIAYSLGIIAHIVDDACRHVFIVRLEIIIIITDGLAL